MVRLGRCYGRCNFLDDSSGKTCVSNKTYDVNLNAFAFSMITRINEGSRLRKYISWTYQYKFDGRKCDVN